MHMIERRKVLTGIGLTIGAAGMSLAGNTRTCGRTIARKGIDKGSLLVAWLVVFGDIPRRPSGPLGKKWSGG